MNGDSFGNSIRSVDGDRRRNCGTQTGAGRIARLKAVPPAARVGVERAVLLDLEPCHSASGVLVRAGKWRPPLRSSARHSLDYHAPV